tara:strand:+ start:146 stop:673 length:528 start_codon:yes stop_codon:yes gene_type:complete
MAGGLEDLIKQVVASLSGSGTGGGSSNSKQQVIDYLKDKGYSNEAIAGITANIDIETGGTFNYKEKEDLKVTGDELGEGYGLFQFSGSMKKNYEKYKKNKKKKDSIETQIDFMDEIVKGTSDHSLGNIPEQILKGELFSGKFGPDRIAESFNSIFEGGKFDDRRKASAIDIFKSL